MNTYHCAKAGVYRLDATGPTHLCPPIVVLGSCADPQRPAGKLIHLAWANQADGPWEEAHLPTPMVANSATLEAILAPSGWRPLRDDWHSFLCDSAITHLGMLEPEAELATAC